MPQMKFGTWSDPARCIALFTARTGQRPTIIRMPPMCWDRCGQPDAIDGVPVERCDGRMIVLESV